MAARKKGRREFTPEFRAEAVNLMNIQLRDGVSLNQIGRDLDLEPDLLRKWARQLGLWTGDDEPAESTETELKKEVKQLRHEVAILRQERDFLKKATAFFAKESR
jgi:transposase